MGVLNFGNEPGLKSEISACGPSARSRRRVFFSTGKFFSSGKFYTTLKVHTLNFNIPPRATAP